MKPYILLPIKYPFDDHLLTNTGEECNQILGMTEEYYANHGLREPLIGYFVTMDGEAMGTCSFVQDVCEGKVEIAYWTFERYERKGVASFACAALVDIASMHQEVNIVCAKTEPQHNASTAILLKNGFVHVDDVEDHEIGLAWYWERKVK